MGYEFTVLPFGLVSSPAILPQVLEVIIHGISDEQVRRCLTHAMYMDDILIGAEDSQLRSIYLPHIYKDSLQFHYIMENLINDFNIIRGDAK